AAAWRARQRRAIARGERAAPRDEGVQPRQLAPAERGLHVGHLVVEARRQLGALVVVARVARARDEIGGACDRSPLTRGEELGRVEGAHRESPPRADLPAAEGGAERLRTVLDERDTQALEVGEVDREPERM